jgi:MFS family permease
MRATRFFAVGSILCAVATNIGVLIAGLIAVGRSHGNWRWMFGFGLLPAWTRVRHCRAGIFACDFPRVGLRSTTRTKALPEQISMPPFFIGRKAKSRRFKNFPQSSSRLEPGYRENQKPAAWHRAKRQNQKRNSCLERQFPGDVRLLRVRVLRRVDRAYLLSRT